MIHCEGDVLIHFPIPDNDEDCLVAVVKIVRAYFDESGKLNDSAVVSFCGAVGFVDEWVGFDREWNARLQDNELSYVKMADAMNWKGPFTTWKNGDPNREALRDEFLLGMAKYACKRVMNLGVVTNPIRSDQFKCLPEEMRQRFKDPVYMSFESCVRTLYNLVTRRYVGKTPPIHICYDCSEQYAGRCLNMFHRMRRNDSDLRKTIQSISFADEQNVPGLQLVDMIAYCEREILLGRERDIVKELNQMFQRFAQSGVTCKTVWDSSELGEGKTEALPS